MYKINQTLFTFEMNILLKVPVVISFDGI